MPTAHRLVGRGTSAPRRATSLPRPLPQIDTGRGAKPAPPYRVLSPAGLVTLHVTPCREQESRRAFEILAAARTGFRVVRAPDDRIAVEFAGQVYGGVVGVQAFHDALGQFDQTLFRPGPDLDPVIARMRRPGIKEQANRELRQQLDAARVELESILARH